MVEARGSGNAVNAVKKMALLHFSTVCLEL